MRLSTHQELMAPSAPTPASVRAFLQKYIEEFLCKPHPQLGRTGPVCPFMGPALRQNTVYYVVIEDEHVSAEKIDSVLAEICGMFLNIHPNSGTSASYKAVIILFPSLPLDKAPILIDGAQERGKPSFVAKGLMLGEFHALNTTIGLRCPMGSTFFPLQTPIPALAIRSLVPSDIVFLDRPNYAPEIRGSFLQSYYSRFSAEPSVTPSVTEPNAAPITVISRPPSPLPQQAVATSPAKLQSTTPSSFFIYAFSLFLLVVLSLSYAWLRTGAFTILF